MGEKIWNKALADVFKLERLVSPQIKSIPAVSDAFAAQNYQKDSHLQVRLNPLKALNTFFTSVPGGGQSCGEVSLSIRDYHI